MSDYTSNPSSSRPGSPVGSLRDFPTTRKPVAPFRFQWDAATRKPGPGSVFSEANTESRGDYFTATPRVDIYGASASSTSLALASVPEEWSSSKHGFNAISTVVNNPHKKSAPPKAHAAVPAVPPTELPRVRRKDFDAYLRAVGPEWDRFHKNVELGRSGAARLGEGSSEGAGDGDLDLQSDASLLARPGRALPPLASVPDIFFAPGFNLGDPRTFNAVAEVVPSDNGDIPDPASPAHSQPLLERLSRHADTIEQHLVHEIARRAAPFFAALSNLQDLQAESAQCLARIQSLRNQLRAVDTQGSARGLRGVAREARLSNLQSVQEGTKAVGGVIEMTRLVRNFVGAGQWVEALDVVDTLHVMWDGAALPSRPDPPLHTSSHDSGFSSGTPLSSVAEDDEEHQQLVASTSSSTLSPSFPLSSLSAFASLPEQLQQLTTEIASALTTDMVSVLKVALVERIHRTGSEARLDAGATLRERLRPLVSGIVRTLSVRETLKGWRDAALGEMKGVIKHHIRSFELEDDDSKQLTDPPWADNLRAMSHQDFLALLRAIYRDYLSGLEGMQALNDALVDVIDRVRSEKAPVDMNAAREEMFDTLASAAELANTLTSRVLSVRTEQNARLELVEFAELFRETWNFFVRCEVVCRRMIVSLRGVISSQAKSFLQSFHQTRISQSAKLVEDEQWQQAEVTPELQRIANLIVDAAVRDPPDFILELSPTVAPPTSPLPTRAMLSPPSQSTPKGLTPPPSPRTRANGSTNTKHIRIEDRAYFAVSATQQTLLALTDYLKVIINLQTLTTDTMGRIIEFLKAFNSRTCQVVLGAGAMRSAGLKNITAKHLALASQSLSIMIALIPYVRETFRRHLNPKQAVMLVEFDKLKRDYQEHQNEIHSKLVAIMGDRLAAHIKALQAVKWDAVPAGTQGPNDYMKLLVKETVTLHKVLSRYLASVVVEFVMSQVFAAINHRLSEEYTHIELPSGEAKERLLADARYLKENFSVLKSVGGVPTGMLEMVVSEKRLPGDAIPASPLPMPATNISLASPKPIPQKRTSLFAGDRIRGMLSRSPTLPTFSSNETQPPSSTSPHPASPQPPASPQAPPSATSSPVQNGLSGASIGDDSAASLASTSTPPPAPLLMSPPKEKKVGFRQVPVDEVNPVSANVDQEPPPPTPAKDDVSPRPVLSVEPERGASEDASLAVSPVDTITSPTVTVNGDSIQDTLNEGADSSL